MENPRAERCSEHSGTAFFCDILHFAGDPGGGFFRERTGGKSLCAALMACAGGQKSAASNNPSPVGKPGIFAPRRGKAGVQIAMLAATAPFRAETGILEKPPADPDDPANPWNGSLFRVPMTVFYHGFSKKQTI
ncbi:MAG: hypothetical protein ACI3WQ_01345 [Faecousia sp.]